MMRLTKSMKLIGLPGLVLALAAAAPSFERGEMGQVSKVLDGDSFVLDSGLEVCLAAVEAPRVRPGDIWGPRATQDLERLILGKKVELRYDGLRRDRRGRAIAHVFVPQGLGKEAVWVQALYSKAVWHAFISLPTIAAPSVTFGKQNAKHAVLGAGCGHPAPIKSVLPHPKPCRAA